MVFCAPFDASEICPARRTPASRETQDLEGLGEGGASFNSFNPRPILSPVRSATFDQHGPQLARAPSDVHNHMHEPLLSLSHLVPSGHFSGAHDVTIGRYRVNEYVNILGPLRTVFDHLEPYIAHGAVFDSSERYNAPTCHENTRICVRRDIMNWIKRDDIPGGQVPERLMWFSGPTGSGKTAIAGSVAEACKKEGLLAASFFFSSSLGFDGNQLAEHEDLHQFAAQLLHSIERNPSIFRKNLKEQADCLLLQPLRKIRGHCDTTKWPKGIIIDGLDMVNLGRRAHDHTARAKATSEHDSDQREILDALFFLAADSNFPFKIFLSSCPETTIQEYFSGTTHPDDIRRFLDAKFASIRHSSHISDPSWPGKSVVDHIIGMSSGQFIVPALIIDWVKSGVPQRRLPDVLQLEKLDDEEKNPFAMLDKVFRRILQGARNPGDDPQLVVKWVLCILDSLGPTPKPTPAQFWRQFLGGVEGEFDSCMASIASLVHVPLPDSEADSPIEVHHHHPLAKFLSSRMRCEDLYVDEGDLNGFLAAGIVRILKDVRSIFTTNPPDHDLFDFIRHFRRLTLLAPDDSASHPSPEAPVLEIYSRFLVFLSERSKADLASCDVALWTDILLAPIYYGDGSVYIFSSGDHGTMLLGSIYCGIHKAMKVSPYPNPL
ncbi:hypothetical protein FA13DRAFT_1739091 [Coprinellus micaceus]|uniref:Nephrocystin 3-like N-terminal domain-containing protein n=1 Tax=Coprinellus micaceus TaxID=71717 RepID=A0A4Y7SRR3_COPMI|nr:hypothetical protein FA13DRAFT_1739091 [Coprinellus micaceus]